MSINEVATKDLSLGYGAGGTGTVVNRLNRASVQECSLSFTMVLDTLSAKHCAQGHRDAAAL